jgi:hypothetical protein
LKRSSSKQLPEGLQKGEWQKEKKTVDISFIQILAFILFYFLHLSFIIVIQNSRNNATSSITS